MTIYDIAENLGEAFPRAFTSENITAGFKATGFWPFDRNVFGDDEFMSSYVTDPPHHAMSSNVNKSKAMTTLLARLQSMSHHTRRYLPQRPHLERTGML